MRNLYWCLLWFNWPMDFCHSCFVGERKRSVDDLALSLPHPIFLKQTHKFSRLSLSLSPFLKHEHISSSSKANTLSLSPLNLLSEGYTPTLSLSLFDLSDGELKAPTPTPPTNIIEGQKTEKKETECRTQHTCYEKLYGKLEYLRTSVSYATNNINFLCYMKYLLPHKVHY